MPTRRIGFKQLLDAVYLRIDNYSLTDTYRIYNKGNVPDNPTWPYTSFGTPIGGRSASFTTRDTEAEDNVVIIDIWSDYPGDSEVSQMMDNIIQALTSSALTITGYDNPYIVILDYADILDDTTESGEPAKHAVIRMRFQMAPA